MFKKWNRGETLFQKFILKRNLKKLLSGARHIEAMMNIRGFNRQRRKHFWSEFYKNDVQRSFKIFYQ